MAARRTGGRAWPRACLGRGGGRRRGEGGRTLTLTLALTLTPTPTLARTRTRTRTRTLNQLEEAAEARDGRAAEAAALAARRALALEEAAAARQVRQGAEARAATAVQRGQKAPWAAPQLGSCASSGRTWRLWAARHSQGEARPLGPQQLPRMLELAASKTADFTAFDHSGGVGAGCDEECTGRDAAEA